MSSGIFKSEIEFKTHKFIGKDTPVPPGCTIWAYSEGDMQSTYLFQDQCGQGHLLEIGDYIAWSDDDDPIIMVVVAEDFEVLFTEVEGG